MQLFDYSIDTGAFLANVKIFCSRLNHSNISELIWIRKFSLRLS